jgi:hypothetical protein
MEREPKGAGGAEAEESAPVESHAWTLLRGFIARLEQQQ